MRTKIVKSEVNANFNCSIDDAFKIPMLSDATQFLTGYFLIPGVVGFEDDKTWGKEGSRRFPVAKGCLLVKQGRICTDVILKREENRYWNWRIFDFPTWSLFFATKAEGELFFEKNNDSTISVKWVYTFYSKNLIAHPVTWVFTKLLWNGMQRKAITKMKHLAEIGSPYIYE